MDDRPGPDATRGGVSQPADSRAGQGVAYLVNLYPAVSHTFIRREIAALERQGLPVLRMALRPGTTVDAADAREKEKTLYVLDQGLRGLLSAVLRTLLSSPRRLGKAVGMALRMAVRSDRPWPIHLAYVAEACVVARWMRERGVTHLHAHFATNPAEIAMLTHLLGGVSYSFTAHGSDIMDRPAQVGLPCTVGHAAFVAAVCAYGRAQICRWVPYRLWPRVVVIRCGLDPGYAGPSVPPAPSRRLQFVCVGRLSAEKGQLVLLDAVVRLRERGTAVDVVLVGDGPLRAELERRVADAGLGASVRFLGAQDADGVRAAISDSRALVVPSLSEGLPVVIMEAMALGRPVVAPFLAGIPELVTQGVTGWLYPAGDADRLAAAMLECLRADPEAIDSMSDAALRVVAEAHDVDKSAGLLVRSFGESANVRSSR